MGQINLGRVVPNYIGEWNSTREYINLDVVSHSGSSYICKRTNKNSAPSATNSNWVLLAQGYGTNLNDSSITTSKIADGAVTKAKIADGAVDESKLSTTVNNRLNTLEVNFNGAYDDITEIEATLNPLPSKVTQLETNQVGLNRELMLMKNTLTPIEEKCTQILYLGSDLNAAADAYNMSAVFDVVTNSNVKIICFDTKYGKGGTIYQQIADNYTTQYLFFEGKTRSSYMRTFNATTGEAIHSWKEISFFTDFEFNTSDYKIYGYTAGKDSVGTLTKKREIINLSSIKTAIDNAGGSSSVSDGSITSAKLANNAVTSSKIASNAVEYGKIQPYDFTTSKIIGKTKLNISTVNNETTIPIECRTYSLTIENPLDAPYEYNISELLGIGINDMVISYRGSYKGYDNYNNIVDCGFYPHERLGFYYSHDGSVMFTPVFNDISQDVIRMDIILIIEYVRV